MVSFRDKLAEGLAKRGVRTCSNLDERSYEAILVIGGTRKIGKLWRARLHGIPIIQRLDGMNWIHRVKQTGLRHYLRAEYGNMLLSFIRSNLATRVVYQSEFSLKWWERVKGKTKVPVQVIYNGVDLNRFSPYGPRSQAPSLVRILLVEGNLGGGYESGLKSAVELAINLSTRLTDAYSQKVAFGSSLAADAGFNMQVELIVVGRVSTEVQDYWERIILQYSKNLPVQVTWAGVVAHERIPEIDRSAHLLFSADINAACPNAVIEAMACGTPVVSFGTGALPELVQGEAGRIVPYGGDPWKLDQPDIAALSAGALEVLQGLPRFRAGARQRAEQVFGLDEMVDRYLAFMLA
jgi:glycosyltransferase involved in cell wall biosynthesis